MEWEWVTLELSITNSDHNTSLEISIFGAKTLVFPHFWRFAKVSEAKSQLSSAYWAIVPTILSLETPEKLLHKKIEGLRNRSKRRLQRYIQRVWHGDAITNECCIASVCSEIICYFIIHTSQTIHAWCCIVHTLPIISNSSIIRYDRLITVNEPFYYLALEFSSYRTHPHNGISSIHTPID